MQRNILCVLCLFCALSASAQLKHIETKVYRITSPDESVAVEVSDRGAIMYSVFAYDTPVLTHCRLGLEVEGRGDVQFSAIASTKTDKKKEHITAPFYRQAAFDIEYTQLTLRLKGGFDIEFRAYNDGVAYRFVSTGMKNKEYRIADETVELNFAEPGKSWLAYSTNPRKPEAMAFQAVYSDQPIAKQPTDNLAFLPCVVACGPQINTGEGIKVTLMESDVEAYPGMFVKPDGNGNLQGWFARYPKTFDTYPWRVQRYVKETESYIARCRGNRTFPWRIIGITHRDTDMPTSNLVYALASPNRIGATDWIKPGLVSWDWWNDWGLSHVPFKAGINMDTYKYYIDFAAKYKLPYIILDEGWYNPKSGDMLTTIPEIDLPALVQYGKDKGVRIILWTVFNVLDDQLDAACKKYADMGIAGFKVDFLDRNDQEGVEMAYRIAERCAQSHLMLDYHGIYPPTGMCRTYPNVVNFESIFGMEEAKWTKHDEQDMPLYDVTFPFIRQQAGYTDFTPGGMRNATRADFQPVYNNPMTMGTRCHQLAMYIVHDTPLTMLADNPTAYEQEPQFTEFIAAIPTVFDETRILDGVMGKYIVTARRKGDAWYVAGQTNWDARDITVLFNFLDPGVTYKMRECIDGPNADKNACDYQLLNSPSVDTSQGLKVHMASGGGFAFILTKN